MAKRVEKELFLRGLRAAWFTLDEADFKFNNDGVYGVGAKLDEVNADLLNGAVVSVANESGEVGKSYSTGGVLKTSMSAGGLNKKTKERWTVQPQVFLPDLTPATLDDIKRLTRKSKFTLKVKVQSYTQIGAQVEETLPDGSKRMVWPTGHRAGGVSVKFLALQILDFDAGEPSAAEQGFEATVPQDQEGF